jgi:hypothetical protein
MYLMCAADRMLVKVGGKFVISADTPALCRRHTARFEEFTSNLYHCNLPKTLPANYFSCSTQIYN